MKQSKEERQEAKRDEKIFRDMLRRHKDSGAIISAGPTRPEDLIVKKAKHQK